VALLLDRIDAETRELRADGLAQARLGDTLSVDRYIRFLSQSYGFVQPLERALLRTRDFERVLDARRMRKHELIARDLDVLGLARGTVETLPQCTAIPWFDDVRDALGWAWVIEHATLAHMGLFHLVARALPGEAAFAATYLKCYFGAVGEMWRSFGEALDDAARTPDQAQRIVDAAKQGLRASRRWWQSHERRRRTTRDDHVGG